MGIVKNQLIINSICILFVLGNIRPGSCIQFKIAFLAPGQSSSYPVNSGNSVDGLKLALRSVEKNPNILNGHKIAVKFFDTKCDSQSAVTTTMMAKSSYNPDAIVGPPCQEGLKMVAQLGAYWNIPVMNWYHTGNEFNSAQKYPTLVRMTPPLHLLSKTLVNILTQNSWTQISMLYTGRTPWSLLEDPVREDTALAGIEMHGVYKMTPNMTSTALKHMFKHIKRIAQAIVMVCPFEDVRHYLLTAATEGMTNGQFTFIHLDPQIYSDTDLATRVLSDGGWKRGDANDEQARIAYQSLIHVLINPMSQGPGQRNLFPSSKYTEYSRLAGIESRFNQPSWELPLGKKPDVYSAYLCDAVVVWAVLVDLLQKQGKDHRDGKLMGKYMRMMTATGATGHISLNNNLDRLGEVYILDMQPDGNFKPVKMLKFDKDDGYKITNMDSGNQPLVQGKGKTPGQRPDHFKPPGQTMTTEATTTMMTTLRTMSTTVAITNPPPTTQSSTVTTTPKLQTAAVKEVSNVPTQPDVTKANVNPTPSSRRNFKTRITVDPHIANFDVRRKKKRRMYFKAQHILDQIRQTGDPNVAAFLRLALERLNAEEDLINNETSTRSKLKSNKNKRKRKLTKKGKANKTIQTKKKAVPETQEQPKAQAPTAIASTLPVTKPTTTMTTTTVITQPRTESTAQKTTSTTTLPSTSLTTTSKIVTTTAPKPTTTTPIPTTVPFIETTTTQAPTTTPKRQGRKRHRKRKQRNFKRKRRLRQKWLNQAPPTTKAVRPTTDAPEAPDSELLLAEQMINSIVSKAADKFMGKVKGELSTIKKTIKTMQSSMTNTESSKQKENVKLKQKKSEVKSKDKTKTTPAVDINRSLINDISANVLTKLSGVSWLEQKPKPSKPKPRPETQSATKVPAANDIYQKIAEATANIPSLLQPPPELPVEPSVPNLQRTPVPLRQPPSPSPINLQPQQSNAQPQPQPQPQPVPSSLPLNPIPQPSPHSQAPLANLQQPPPPLQNLPVLSPVVNPAIAIKPIPVTEAPKKPAPPKIVGNWMSGLPPALSMQLFAVETAPSKIANIQNIPINSMPIKGVSSLKNVPKKVEPLPSLRSNPFGLKVTKVASHGHTKVVLPKAVPPPAAKHATVPVQKKSIDNVGLTPVQYQTQTQQVQPPQINMDTVIAKITNSVLGKVSQQMDSLKMMMGNKQTAPPTTTTTTTTTTMKPVLSLRKTFDRTVTSNRAKPPSKAELVNQISEAVILQLTNHAGVKVQEVTNKPFPTVQGQEHEPEGVTTTAKTTNTDASGGALVDKITSKVFGKMNAKLEALSQSVNGLKQTFGRQELEELPPELFAGVRNQMMGGQSPMQNFNAMSNPTEMASKLSEPQMPQKMPWMPPMNSWMMPNQQNMWGHSGSSGNSRTPWWE